MPEQPESHVVTIKRNTFEFEPIAELPPWWRPGDRVTARRGERVVVNSTDYARGLVVEAFEGEPPVPTRTVTVQHGAFDHVPQPFPAWQPEFYRRTALRGHTITVTEDDYERGQAQGAFETPPTSAYGLAGDPPLTGSVVAWINWCRVADDVALEVLLDHLTERAAGDTDQLRVVPEVRSLLFDHRDTNGQPLTVHLNRAHTLMQTILATHDTADEILALVRAGRITDPAALKVLLTAAQQRTGPPS